MSLLGKNKKNQRSNRKLQIVASPEAPFAYVEAYKSLRTNLKFIANTSGAHSFVITSAVPEESKSNTAINLAITLAMDGQNVILVDCDLRKPVLHKYMKSAKGRKGLTNVLAGEVELESCIAKFKDINISALVAGTIPPNPSELLSSQAMADLMETLKERYDYAIVDAPPVSVVTDAAIVGNLVDGALLVIRSKYATIDSIKLAKQKLEEVSVKIFGAVITRYDVKASNKKTGYSYSYGYEYYKE